MSCSKDFPLILIHPPAVSKRYLKTKFMPYGMAVVNAFLREHGVPVVQYDFLMEYLFSSQEDPDYHNPERSFSQEQFFSFLGGAEDTGALGRFARKYGDRLPPDARIYAFSVVAYHQFWAALLLGRYIRTVNPEAMIVFGGPFITIKPADAFVPYGVADYWIRGSGEIPLLMLHRMIQEKDGVKKEHIPGIVYVDGGKIHEKPRSQFRAEDERPPDFGGLSLSDYRYDHPVSGYETFFLPYRISKGCPSRCSFCTGRLVDRYDIKSGDKVVREIAELADTYGTVNFQLADASINGHPRRLHEICTRLSAEAPAIKWYSYAKVNGFSPQLLEQVKRAGCFSLFWGVESAYEPTIRLLGKRFTLKSLYELIDESIRLGIKNYIHLIYNTPRESTEDVLGLMGLIERYIDSDFVEFLPQRFLLEAHSLMYEHPEQYGLADIRRVNTGPFEREQYIYREPGLDFAEVEQRNRKHRRMLEDHLEWIRYQSILKRCRKSLLQHVPSRLLVTSGRLARRFQPYQSLHHSMVRWLESQGREIREQL